MTTRLRLAMSGVALAAALIMGSVPAAAQTTRQERGDIPGGSQLSALWWQWLISIPNDVSPFLDRTGANCMVGQRGPIWFLAGFPSGSAERQCSIPAATELFFPVLNVVGANSPGCGQGPEDLSLGDIRQGIADILRDANPALLSVKLDGVPVSFSSIQSDVFPVWLQANNLFGCPSAIYSPSADAGFYSKVGPLQPGAHKLVIKSLVNLPPLFSPFDVTYNLTVVPVRNQ